MNPASQPPTPSRTLKAYSLVTQLVWRLVLISILLFGTTWAVLNWVIVPGIERLRPLLESQATKALGVPVRIGRITAVSSGLVPSFELTDVVLLDPQGLPALTLARVAAAVSPRSLWNLGFEQLLIDQPELDIRRTASGQLLIAGLALSGSATPQDNDATLDWLFSQTELVVRGGTVRWTDEQRGAPPLALGQVDLVIRNSGRTHAARMDASPPDSWGERFSLRGIFRQPRLSLQNGRWKEWEGQLYADLPRIDVSTLRQYADLGVDIKQGVGRARVWAQVQRGSISGATADLSLQAVRATLGPRLEPLLLDTLSGRLAGEKITDGYEVKTQGLAFQTTGGVRWPGGNARLRHTQARNQSEQGQLQADNLDLAALSQIASRLPLGSSTHAALAAYAPQGVVDSLQATWRGPLDQPLAYQAKGRVSQFQVAAQAAIGSPGVRGARVDFDFSQAGGQAKLALQNGALNLPGVFAEPVLPLDLLSGDLKWDIRAQAGGDKLSASLTNLRFANADAQGQLEASWQTSDPAKAASRSRFPGVVDIKGSISRADGARIFRYLPLTMRQNTREYVRDSVVAGTVTDVKFRVKGDATTIASKDSLPGEFLISGNVKNATFAFAPPSVAAKGAAPWPVLTQLNGQMSFDHNSLRVTGATGVFSAGVGAAQGLQLVRAEAQIPDLHGPTTVLVSGDIRGSLDEALRVVNTSPLSAMMGDALAQAKGSGPADFRIRLNLPVTNIDRARISGTATLAGNDLHITPGSPPLQKAQGQVVFTESGFALVGVQAGLLGGQARLEGGMRPGTPGATPTTVFKAQGTTTAAGLRQTPQLGIASRLASTAVGSTTYNATLGFFQGAPEILVTSTLQGMALGLPAPFNKAADAQLPLRFENTMVRDAPAGAQHDVLLVELGRLAAVRFVRDVSGPQPRVLRGSLGVGLADNEAAPTPEQGVTANINLTTVNIDAWEALFDQISAEGTGAGGTTAASTATAIPPSPPLTASAARASASATQSYLPTNIALRARELSFEGRTLNNLVIGGSRQGLIWRANLDATQLNGYVEYRQSAGGGAGGLYARLSRLQLTQTNERELDALLDEQPANLPALDVVVDDLELRGKKLGRLEIDAVNRGAGAVAREGGVREWRLRKLNLTMPEASFTATGNWAAVGPTATPPGSAPGTRPLARASTEQRRTVMSFKLDIADSGKLLNRFGMKDVVRGGKGRMEGQVSWLGSPTTLDNASLNGYFNINLEAGQFLKADPGIAKLLGVLSLQSLPRRLTLDFRDVFSQGFSFDFVRGDVTIEQGIAATNNLQMKGVNAAVLMDGKADIARETQDIKVLVVPEIDAGTASLVAAVINPAIGITSFLAQLFLRRPLIQAATQEFQISGSWADPKVERADRKAAPAVPASTPSPTPEPAR